MGSGHPDCSPCSTTWDTGRGGPHHPRAKKAVGRAGRGLKEAVESEPAFAGTWVAVTEVSGGKEPLGLTDSFPGCDSAECRTHKGPIHRL